LGESDPILKDITLNPQQNLLIFDVGCIPQDLAHQRCGFCHHYSANIVKRNEGMGQRNNAKEIRHKEKMEVWIEYQVAVKATQKRNEDQPPKLDDPQSTSDLPKKVTQKPQKLSNQQEGH